MSNNLDPCKVKMMIIIADSKIGYKAEEIYIKEDLPVSFMMHGKGSASSQMMDYLGLENTRKVVLVSFLPCSRIQQVYEVLQTKLKFNGPGTGIAFTLPVSSISSVVCQLCTPAQGLIENDGEGYSMPENQNHAVIITIVNSGHFEKVMEIAKAAGATGGTLFHARGLGSDEAVKFLGINIQPEKDVVLIIVPKDKKKGIMKDIVDGVGLNTEGKGICFSIPVESAMGLS